MYGKFQQQKVADKRCEDGVHDYANEKVGRATVEFIRLYKTSVATVCTERSCVKACSYCRGGFVDASKSVNSARAVTNSRCV